MTVSFCRDRFRTMINVLGDALAAGIMAHICRKEFIKDGDEVTMLCARVCQGVLCYGKEPASSHIWFLQFIECVSQRGQSWAMCCLAHGLEGSLSMRSCGKALEFRACQAAVSGTLGIGAEAAALSCKCTRCWDCESHAQHPRLAWPGICPSWSVTSNSAGWQMSHYLCLGGGKGIYECVYA